MKCNCDMDSPCEEPECIEWREQFTKEMYYEYIMYCIKDEDGNLIDVRDLPKYKQNNKTI